MLMNQENIELIVAESATVLFDSIAIEVAGELSRADSTL